MSTADDINARVAERRAEEERLNTALDSMDFTPVFTIGGGDVFSSMVRATICRRCGATCILPAAVGLFTLPIPSPADPQKAWPDVHRERCPQ